VEGELLNNRLFGTFGIFGLSILSLLFLAGTATAACTDGDTICVDEYKQATCLNNEYSQVTVCNIVWGCDASLQACRYCSEGSTGCEGDYAWVCTNGIREKTFCQFGCNPATNACYPSDPDGEICTPEGITECTSNDNNGGYYKQCTSGTWQEGLYCPYNCDLSTNECYECDNSQAAFCSDATTSTKCTGTFYKGGYYVDTPCGAAGCNPTTGLCNSPTAACTDGEQQCNATVRQLCSAGAWGDIVDCAPDTCVQVNATSTICQATPTCTDGDMQCNATMRQLCSGGAWTDVPPDCSASGEICVQVNATSAICQATPTCTDGDMQCNATMRQLCSGGAWTDVPPDCSASGEICVSINATSAVCQAVVTPVCTDGDMQCNATMRQLCSGGAWTDVPPDCSASGEICVQASPTSAVCIPLGGCPLGDEICLSNDVWECIASGNSTVWAFDYTCPASAPLCTESAGVATCIGIPIVISGGSGQFGGVYDTSGGGSVSRCTQFTDWTADSSIEYVQTGADGSSRDCANTTLVRYCREGGKINYYDYEKKYTVDCGEWSDKCDYVYTKTLQYDESDGGLCRSCQKDIYTYACQPSGKLYADNVKESAKCEEWAPCQMAAQEEQKRSGLDALLEDYGLFLGLILILLILAVAYTAYKMVDEEPEDPDGFGKGSEPGI